MEEFREELERLINKYSCENESDTPDFILAEYLYDCLNAFDSAVRKRETWWGRKQEEPSKQTVEEAKATESLVKNFTKEDMRTYLRIKEE